MTQYQYPFPLDTITTDFGAVDPEHPNPHRGTDFAPGGIPIPAVSDGVVVRDERQTGLGNVVTVRADDGIFWACSHMADRTPFNVGDRVARGDTVGVVGNTGSLTTGRHLHFTMSPSSDDPASGPVFDSVPYITARLTSFASLSVTSLIEQEEEEPMKPLLLEISNADKSTQWALVSGDLSKFVPIWKTDTANSLSRLLASGTDLRSAIVNVSKGEWNEFRKAAGLPADSTVGK